MPAVCSRCKKKFQADFRHFSRSFSSSCCWVFPFDHYILLATFFHSIFFLYLSLSHSQFMHTPDSHLTCTTISEFNGKCLNFFFRFDWCWWFEFEACTIYIIYIIWITYIDTFIFLCIHTGEMVKSEKANQEKITTTTIIVKNTIQFLCTASINSY